MQERKRFIEAEAAVIEVGAAGRGEDSLNPALTEGTGSRLHLASHGSRHCAVLLRPQPSANSQDKSYSLIPSPRMTV